MLGKRFTTTHFRGSTGGACGRNNPLERLLREVRRRTRAVGALPDGKSALMLSGARLRHVAGHATLPGYASLEGSERGCMNLVLLRPEEFRYGPAAAAVKAPDELAALGLDCGPRRPRSLAIRAKEVHAQEDRTTARQKAQHLLEFDGYLKLADTAALVITGIDRSGGGIMNRPSNHLRVRVDHPAGARGNSPACLMISRRDSHLNSQLP